MNDTLISTDPKIGVVLGTYGTVPYVHLQLENARRFYPNHPLLVRDDGSPSFLKLNDLSMEYGVEFSTAGVPSPRVHGVGDVAVFWHGLLWARRKGLDLLVKISRRWLLSRNWVPELIELAVRTQYPTYTNRCRHYNYGFRPEFIALHVDSWCCDEILSDMQRQMERGQLPCLPERYLHDLALMAHRRNRCSVNARWEEQHGFQDRGGYGAWNALGENRHAVPPDVLWHDQHGPEAYLRKACDYGLSYALADFAV